MIPERYRPSLLWLIGGLSIAVTVYRSWHFIYDDAYISFRYARNLIEHGELVWNLGERVEGYTNFLHLLGTSSLMLAGLAPEIAARSLNLAAALALVLLYLRIARRIAPGAENALPCAIGGLFLLGSACLPLWLLGGLEPVLVAAFELAAIGFLLPLFEGRAPPRRDLLLSGLLFGLAYLTRPDAVVIAGAALLGGLLFAPLALGPRLRDLVIVGLVITAVVAVHVLWRFDYYGTLVPNTYHAKVGVELAGRLAFGARYALVSLITTPLVPVALLLFVATVRAKAATPVMPMLATCLVAHIGYVVWAGGDHLPAARFFVPLLAPGALLIAAALAPKERGGRPSFRPAVAILGILGAVITPLQFSLPYHGGAVGGAIIGKYIDATWPRGALVALNVAGATPYFAPEHRFLDMLGLNDPVIARRDPIPRRTAWQDRPGHAKGDGAYVLSRRPDFVILGAAFGADAEDGLFLGDVELAESQEFRDCYRREASSISADDPRFRASADFRPDVDFIYYRRICPPQHPP